MGWLQRIFGTSEQATERRAQAFVAELSVAQAALRVRELLQAHPDKFIVEPDAGSLPLPALAHHLAPAIRALFEDFAVIRMQYSDLVLESAHIGPSDLAPGFLRLGESIAHSEILARPDEEEVFIVDGAEREDERLTDRHKSVYHYVLYICTLVHPELVPVPPGRVHGTD